MVKLLIQLLSITDSTDSVPPYCNGDRYKVLLFRSKYVVFCGQEFDRISKLSGQRLSWWVRW